MWLSGGHGFNSIVQKKTGERKLVLSRTICRPPVGDTADKLSALQRNSGAQRDNAFGHQSRFFGHYLAIPGNINRRTVHAGRFTRGFARTPQGAKNRSRRGIHLTSLASC
jgi:hypothetical protein